MFKKQKLSKEEQEQVDSTFEEFSNAEYDPKKAEEILKEESKNKLNKKASKKIFAKYTEDLMYVWKMIKDYCAKKYTVIPAKSIATFVLALIYIITPLDIIPDFLPISGLLDDSAIFAACLAALKSDFTEYKSWKKEEEEKSI